MAVVITTMKKMLRVSVKVMKTLVVRLTGKVLSSQWMVPSIPPLLSLLMAQIPNPSIPHPRCFWV